MGSDYRRIDKRAIQQRFPMFTDTDPYVLLRSDGSVSICAPNGFVRRNLRELAWQLTVMADEIDREDYNSPLVPLP